MKIGITTFGGDCGRSGIGQYIVQLLRAFGDARGENHYEVLVHEGEKPHFMPGGADGAALCIGNGFRNPILNVAWHQIALPGWCKRRGWDALFLPAGNRRVPVASPCPTVGTVHDFSSLHVKNKYDPARMFYITRVLPALIRRLTRIITISQSSKRDIVTYVGVPAERIDVIPLGVDHQRFFSQNPEVTRRVCRRYDIQLPYILYVARIEHPGKNHVRLIRAFERLKTSEHIPHQLVLAGSDRERAEEVHAVASASPWASDIIFTGFLPDEDLPGLYSGADVAVLPSLYEGFGLPVLEAMACGVPVACSDLSSLPEVAGEAAVLFDPYDEAAMAEAIQKLIGDAGLRAAYTQRGLNHSREYTWSKTAAKTLATIQAAAEEGL